MDLSDVILRPAAAADVAGIAAVEREAWPAPLAASEAQVRARLAAFPPGQLIAELDGVVVGVAWSQRIDECLLARRPATFAELTDGGRFTATHQPAGAVFQLIGVGVSSAGRQRRLGRRLVDAELALARELPGVRRIVGFTRPVGYHRHPQLSLPEYAALRDERGRPVDPMLAFHLGAGAWLDSLHPDFRPEDAEARGCGALIEYPLRG